MDEVGINDVLDLLRRTNIDAIKTAFSDLNPAEDPVIRFYEGFLKAYDLKQRIQRGVFFTPRPVVSYIVRSVHELLQTEFGLEDGLASTATWADMVKKFPDLKAPKDVKPDDPFVCILDPATGTGTFLYECIEVIERTMKDKWRLELRKKSSDDPEILGRWRDYVRKQLLTRLHGFEIMMAPYSIAHLKLALKLGETGYQFKLGDRLHIYLTNSLEPATTKADSKLADMFSTLAKEAQDVNELKRKKRFTVVIGNPPYAGLSANMTESAAQLIEPYKYIENIHFGERKHWLHDDYVKFIRLSQIIVDAAKLGVVGLITNHAYLDNPTFRGMRWNLMQSFGRIRVLDLHGNTMKREKNPTGNEDKNVFDIQQGVAISLFVKQLKRGKMEVTHGALWGTRAAKYAKLLEKRMENLSRDGIVPVPEFYFFVPRNDNYEAEYQQWIKLNDVFAVFSGGFITARDHFVIDIDRDSLVKRMEDFIGIKITDEDIRKTYFRGCGSDKYPDGDTRGWKIPAARKSVRHDKDWQKNIRKCLYRPFDERWVYWSDKMVDWPRPEVSEHLLNPENIALVFMRQAATGDQYSHFMVSRMPIDNRACYSNKGIMTMAPLYLHGSSTCSDNESFRFDDKDKHPNFTPQFIRRLRSSLIDTKKKREQTSKNSIEDIFHYAYAVFHSPTYRVRYQGLLKIDFPRLPLTDNLEMFRVLAKLGGDLVALHLMESSKLDDFLTVFVGGRMPQVEKVSYSNKTVWIDKDQSIGFKGIPEDVWNFHLGGYQVCEKWLKDRKGRQLSKADINHYQKIVVAVNETIKIMAKIDKVIDEHGGWPIK